MKVRKKPVKKRIFLATLAVLSAFLLTGAGAAVLIYNSQTIDASRLVSPSMSVRMFDKDDNYIQGFDSDIKIADIADHTKWAFICIEDKDFYTHNGISFDRIFKAAYKNLKSGKTLEGASTITQQLIKNTHLSHEKTLTRKIREVILAHKLEKLYSKDEILEMYLNIIYFGNGLYGIESASRFYFDKPAATLNLKESAALAGMIKSPAHFDPITKPKNFSERADLVLSVMLAQKKITPAQYNSATNCVMVPVENAKRHDIIHSYRAAAVTQASRLLGKTVGEMSAEGYKIYTFFDKAAQQTVIDTVTADEYQIKNVSGAAADICVIAATARGEITALHTNNPIIPFARRNFASALKPLAVYAPAIELGTVTPSTVISDTPYAAGDFHPKNFDGLFRGDVTVRESLARSYNIPAVKILEYTRPCRAADIAKSLGLPLGDENLSLALGNTNRGISFTELVGGYAALANGGLKTDPTCIKRIETRGGKTVWEYTAPYLRVLSEETCCLITDMLKEAVATGTAAKLSSLDFEIASKTGTAQRQTTNTDAINVSYTPTQVLAVWHGNADMDEANDLKAGTTGGGITSFIARDIAKGINQNKKDSFTIPAGVEKTAVGLSGKSTSDDKVSGNTTSNDGISNNITSRTALRLFINLTGKIGDTGAPTLNFNARGDGVYSLKRKIGDIVSLLEVIKNHEGEYTYTDRTAPENKISEYWVECKIGETAAQSNRVKIYTNADINRAPLPKRSAGKHWFFNHRNRPQNFPLL